MTRKATTFRLDPDLHEALALLSEVQGRSQNQLVNDAVRELVNRRIREVEIELEATLARLRPHRVSDLTASLEAAMRAEAAVEEDPAEGVPQTAPLGPETAGILARLGG